MKVYFFDFEFSFNKNTKHNPAQEEEKKSRTSHTQIYRWRQFHECWLSGIYFILLNTCTVKKIGGWKGVRKSNKTMKIKNKKYNKTRKIFWTHTEWTVGIMSGLEWVQNVEWGGCRFLWHRLVHTYINIPLTTTTIFLMMATSKVCV